MNKITKILIYALIPLLFVPPMALGGSFVASLIDGKTPAEAVQIIAGQIDSLLGRVSTLETNQTATELEIERLKLENENLKLKAEQTATQAQDTEKAIGLIGKCEAIEKPMTCRQNEINDANKQINVTDLPYDASMEEVAAAFVGTIWYPKIQTNELCYKDGGGTEHCKSKDYIIKEFNANSASARQSAAYILKDRTPLQESAKLDFEKLQCPAILEKYAPARQPPGCG